MEIESIVNALSQPDAYPTPPPSVSRLETHISVIFFAGDRVYKLKKPVQLDFLDFTTLASRHQFCTEEVRLNRRLAPSVYLGVKPVTASENGEIRLDGEGEVIDYVVEMIRLPSHRMMDHKLDRGEIDNQAINDLAKLLAEFHGNAETGESVDRYGEPNAVAKITSENIDQIVAWNYERGCQLPIELVQFLRERVDSYLDEHRELLSRRVASGRIRDGHGDLHSANIRFAESGIVIYDCIEFSAAFRCGDVALDLAFLAMDLDLRCFRGFSKYLVYQYQELAGDHEVADLMEFYKTHRALVRTKVLALQSEQGVDTDRARSLDESLRYLHLAVTYWLPPTLILTCGLPASGKSWAAEQIARPFEAVVLRSDLVRQRQRREAGETRGLDRGLYRNDLTDKTYDLLLAEARKRLDDGRTVIVDATFLKARRRAPFLELARELDVILVVLHAECSEEVAVERLNRRSNDPGEASDADLEVYYHLRSTQEPPDEVPAATLLRISGEPESASVTAALLENIVRQTQREAGL